MQHSRIKNVKTPGPEGLPNIQGITVSELNQNQKNSERIISQDQLWTKEFEFVDIEMHILGHKS
jgi:hypothetical protein